MKQGKRMSFNRRHLAVAGAGALCTVAFGVTASQAAGGEAAVAQAVETYRTGMLGNDKAKLDGLCMDQMTYGHSSGRVQTKAEVLADAAAGQTKWKSISFENPTNRVVGDNAYSRFVFVGENESGGKTNSLKFGVVMVWHKQGSHWKLLVRQGYKI